MAQNELTDESADRKYFVIVPQIVWAQAMDVYDLALWTAVKMVAGDAGECCLSTEDLATLAMMSAGKVSQCRQRLLAIGLLQGELRRDPGYPQPVWHLITRQCGPGRKGTGHRAVRTLPRAEA